MVVLIRSEHTQAMFSACCTPILKDRDRRKITELFSIQTWLTGQILPSVQGWLVSYTTYPPRNGDGNIQSLPDWSGCDSGPGMVEGGWLEN